MNTVFYAKVINIKRGFFGTRWFVKFSSGFELKCTDHQVSNLNVDDLYWVVADSSSKNLIDTTPVSKKAQSDIELSTRNLENATNKLLNSFNEVQAAETAQVMALIGITFSGLVCATSTMSALTALMAAEPVTAVIAGSVAAVSGISTAIQIEQLSARGQACVQANKILQRATDEYRAMMHLYLPDSYKDYKKRDYYYSCVSSKLIHAIPNFELPRPFLNGVFNHSAFATV